jgi:aquaporin Z
MAPLMIGLFIFTAADAIGPASGGSFNPARSLDPVFFNGDFDKVWIYIVGPLVGGVIGGAIWVLFGPARAVEPATIRATGGLSQEEASTETSATPGGANR